MIFAVFYNGNYENLIPREALVFFSSIQYGYNIPWIKSIKNILYPVT